MTAGCALGNQRAAGGKSGLRRIRRWVTPTGRKARESATESKPPRGFGRAVRVKR